MASVGENFKKQRPWSDAIKRALARRADGDGRDLNALADVLVDKALEGDLPALKELGDRLDGKPAQALDVGGQADNPVITEVVRRIVKP
jgi:hypothetical protein